MTTPERAADFINLGVVTTYLYDLIDDGPNKTNSVMVDHFGLFTTKGVAKPGAVAIHDLTTILGDTGASASTLTPTPPNDPFVGCRAMG
jgi:serralysin